MNNLKKLRQEVFDVFITLEYPGDDNIVNSGYEKNEIGKLFEGNLWTEITPTWFDNFSEDASFCLNAFSYNGFRYYLPAALIMYIDEIIKDSADTHAFIEPLISRLTNGPNNDLVKMFDINEEKSGRDDLNVYSFNQKQLIANILSTISELYGIEAITWRNNGESALESYWYKYMEG